MTKLKNFKEFSLNEYCFNNNEWYGPGSLAPLVKKLKDEGKSETIIVDYLKSLGIEDVRIARVLSKKPWKFM